MNNNINFISLPKEVTIPAHWWITPKKQEKIEQVAQPFFNKWEDEPLSRFSSILNVGKITCLIGQVASIYLLSIPSFILCGVVLTVYLIGENAVRREQVVRLQNVCLELEQSLINFTTACDNIEKFFMHFPDRDNNIFMSAENYQELSQLVCVLKNPWRS